MATICTCSICGWTGPARLTQADMSKEFMAQFPGNVEQRHIVCGECYPKVIAWGRKRGLVPGGRA